MTDEPVNVLAGYVILGELGRGGMGVVYKARHTKLNRVVALKMILSGSHAGADDLARFRTEGEAIARLHHPHIVQIHDIGEQNGRPFFSLEFCPGGSLEHKLNGVPMPPLEAATLVEMLARAVHAAHQKGVIHRDLKPGNVLFGEDGAPRITDFGLARKLDEASQTQPGSIMGTPSYMAPEQAGREIVEIGPLADVYALGSILYECLTGRPPFRAATVFDTVMQVVHNDPVPPSQLQPKTPRDLETICLKCLRKEPAQRYASAEDLAEDLRRFRSNEPIQARPASIAERTLKWARRRPAIAALAATALVAAVVLLVGGIYSDQKIRRARDFALFERNTARSEKDEVERLRVVAENQERDARRNLYMAHVNLANAAWHEGRLERALDLLHECLPKEGQDDFRGFEWDYLWRLCHSEPLRITHHFATATIIWSPNGRYLAACGNPAGTGKVDTVTVWDAHSGQEVATFREPDARILNVAFVPDGSELVLVLADPLRADGPQRAVVYTVLVCQIPSGKTYTRFETPAVQASQSALSGDGTVFALLTPLGLRVWDTVTKKEVPLLPVARQPFRVTTALALSNDGRRLAVAGANAVSDQKDWDAVSIDLNAGEENVLHYQIKPRVADADPEHVLCLAYSLDGKLLAMGGFNGTLCVAETNRETVLLSQPSGGVGIVQVAFNPDSKMVATAYPFTGVKLWDLGRSFQRAMLPGHAAALSSIAFSRPIGSKRLATIGSDGLLKVWDVGVDLETRMLPVFVNISANLGFSPDGRYLAAARKTPGRAQPQITVQNVETGETMQTLPDEGLVSFAADGGKLRVWNHDKNGLQLWDVNTGKSLDSRTSQSGKLQSSDLTALSPDGRLVAFSKLPLGQQASTVEWGEPWNDKDLNFTKSLGASFEMKALCFSPDGKRLICAAFDAPNNRSTFKLWDTQTGADLEAPPETAGQVQRLFFHPDNNRLAMIVNIHQSAENKETTEVRVWDLAAGRLALTVPQTSPTFAVAFSPDGKRMAVGGWNRQVRLYETLAGQELLALPVKHGDQVQLLTFSPDGRRLAGVCGRTGDMAFHIRLWDATPPAVLQAKANENPK